MIKTKIWVYLWGLVMILSSLNANQQAFQKQLEEASAKAFMAMQKGPSVVKLDSLAELTLPKEYGFLPADETKALLKLLGNDTQGIMGAIASNPEVDANAQWFVLLTYNDSGHIMDDDAYDWNKNELLESIEEGTDAANKVRRERGFGELQILGWVNPPEYDSYTNRMLWSIKTLNEGASGPGINFNTLALSREGYMSMNLVTQLDRIQEDKVISDNLLSSLDFQPGYKYNEFNEDTDRLAEYGLAALITGVAAKKLGIFAIIIAFIIKFAKIIAIAVAGFFGYKYKKNKAKKKGEEK